MSGDGESFEVTVGPNETNEYDVHRFDWSVSMQSFNRIASASAKPTNPPIPVGRKLVSTDKFKVQSWGNRISIWKVETAICETVGQDEKYIALTLNFLGYFDENGNPENNENSAIDVNYEFQIINDERNKAYFSKVCKETRTFSPTNNALGFNKFLPLSKLGPLTKEFDVQFRLWLSIFDTANTQITQVGGNTLDSVDGVIFENEPDDGLYKYVPDAFPQHNRTPGPLVIDHNGDYIPDDEIMEVEEYEEIQDFEDDPNGDDQVALLKSQHLWISKENADLLLEVPNLATFKVHSDVLAEASPVFEAQIDALSKIRKNKNQLPVLTWQMVSTAKDVKMIEMFLHYLYVDSEAVSPFSIALISAAQFKNLFLMACHYKVEELKYDSILSYSFDWKPMYAEQPNSGLSKDLKTNVKIKCDKFLDVMDLLCSIDLKEIDTGNIYFKDLQQHIWQNIQPLKENRKFKELLEPIFKPKIPIYFPSIGTSAAGPKDKGQSYSGFCSSRDSGQQNGQGQGTTTLFQTKSKVQQVMELLMFSKRN